MKLENVPRNVKLYARRALVYRANSNPFLSGDLFADNADVQLYGPKLRNSQPSRKEVSNARVLFCPAHEFERFIQEYGDDISARVLILGNSDRDFANFDHTVPASIKTIYVQNLYFQDERVRILPIGIENIRLATAGIPALFSEKYLNIKKIKNLLIGPFSPTHVEREPLFKLESSATDGITVLKSRINPMDYASIAAQHKFVAAPRGNGLDTHRFWESLYRGSSPIVIRSRWAETFQRLGLPHIQIEEWSNDCIENVARKEFVCFDPKKLSILWWSYWKQEIAKNL